MGLLAGLVRNQLQIGGLNDIVKDMLGGWLRLILLNTLIILNRFQVSVFMTRIIEL
jgi:hypothetical protein